MKKTIIQQVILFILFHVLIALNLNGQGKTTLVDGHHLAGLNLTLGHTTSIPLNYFVKQQGSSLSNPIPGFNIDVPYSDGNITINGIMSDAAIAIDWWTLFGEPAEQYLFTWKAKDFYEITSLDATGSSTIKRTVNKNDLKKYPDLLLRYENIKPSEIEFEIQWGLEDRDVFSLTGMSFTSYYGVRNSFKTKVSSANILIETSGKTPFGVPGIRQGNGEAFFGLEKNFPKDKLKSLMQLFTKAPYQYINAVIVTKIKWPVGEMKAIADKYDQYERGEATPSPTQIINEELRKNQNLPTYNNNDFWGDADEDNIKKLEIFSDQNSMIGIKTNGKITYQRARTGYFTELIKIPKAKKYFIDVSINDAPITNRLVKIIDNNGRIKVLDKIPNIFDFRIMDNGDLFVYKNLNSFTKIKYGQFNFNLDFTSAGTLKPYLLKKGYLSGEFTTNRNQLENTIRDLLFESTNPYSKKSNAWWGVGEFMEYRLDPNLEIIGTRIVYYTYNQ